MNAYFKYLLVSIFIATVLLIVFVQFNSNRSINRLIDGNQSVLNHIEVKTNLQRLQTAVVMIESKVKGAVISGSVSDTDLLVSEIKAADTLLLTLDSLTTDSALLPLIHDLNTLVKSKIEFNNNIIDIFKTRGKAEAEKLINTHKGKNLTDSIKAISASIESEHERLATALIQEADINGAKAKTLGTIMAGIAALASIFTFVYAAFKVQQQQQLITRLNKSEKKAKEAVQTKENFLANMSHEIRTPLNAILGYTNLLLRKDIDRESHQQIQTIQKSGENLLTIVNDVLDLSKIEAGMMRIESAPFSIRGLAHSVETMLKPKAAEKQLQLTTKVDESLPDDLEGDATRLTQILINLIGNAIKFTHKGSIVVNISNLGIANNEIKTGITVSDTGIGIEKEKLSLIFERFQQAEDAVTRKYGGTGLGLAIVYELVLLQNGTITANSQPGQGTTFDIIIPYRISSQKAPAASNISNKSAINTAFNNIKILVAEDNEINQTLIRHLFKEWNLNYDIANNGKEAIALLQNNSYALVLMDIQMPEMDGYTAAMQIRGSLKMDIPIIAMTAHAMAGEREKCLSYGMNDYISKPIKEELLYAIISRFTGSSIPNPATPESAENTAGVYNTINLQYMKEISMGNIEYERDVTEQFIEVIPEDIKMLDEYWQAGNITALKQTAHDMKTSVSVMGLTEKLQPVLDALEHEELSETSFRQHYSMLTDICVHAVAEAKVFYNTLKG